MTHSVDLDIQTANVLDEDAHPTRFQIKFVFVLLFCHIYIYLNKNISSTYLYNKLCIILSINPTCI